MKKKIVSLMLVAAMSISLCACGGQSANTEVGTEQGTATEGTEAASLLEGPEMSAYGDESSAIYNDILGEYYATYQKAFEAKSVSERYALMAVAEAKLMESAVMIPTTSRGGAYAITHVAPYTGDYVLWGTDENRLHNALVCEELIKTSDRDTMRAKWDELKGTGTYLSWAKEYLVGQGYTLVDYYNYPYSGDPETWDVLGSSRTTTNEPLSQCVDGLLEYDAEGQLQPALAESYEVSADGLTYTFHLRKGVKWVNSQQQEICELTAKDFVNGFQHMMDTQSGLGDLEAGVVAGVTEYINGEVGMDEVGVKATDDYTVVYTLVEPCSYYLTTLEYSAYAPLCSQFYESKGGKYGAEFDATCEYGLTKDDIAYCGPFVCTGATAESEMTFEANKSYYDPSKLNVHSIKFVYESGEDVTKTYTDCKNGTISSAGLNDSTITIAREEGMFDNGYVYISSTDATSYMAFLNVNRFATANSNDTTQCVTAKTADQLAAATSALKNVHIRRAVATALDRVSWNAQKRGDELAAKSLINSYTPGKMFQLTEEVTVDGLGTYPAGTYYGKIMQDQINKDGVQITVWKDGVASDEAGSSYDGWYNPDYAKAELEAGMAELGVEFTAENPLVIDLPYASNDTTYTNCANAFKMSIEKSLEGKVVVNLVAAPSTTEWLYSGYYTEYGWEANYDVFDLSGWGPDYGDPSTYLNTFLPDYSGYMVKCIGLF